MKKYIIWISGIIIILLFTSCKKDLKLENDINSIDIYFWDNNRTMLVSEKYIPVATFKEGIVSELLSALKKTPMDISYVNAIPENIVAKDISFPQEEVLSINFEPNYGELDSLSEIICRAAIVKTLTQVDGVEYIEFTVGGQPLKDSYDKLVGHMAKDDFIGTTSMETNFKVTLYYTNKEGTALLAYEDNISYGGSKSVEEIVVSELIKGPQVEGYYRTISEDVDIIGVVTRDGITYVNLSEKFLNKTLNVSGEITLYSIVNSLAEISGVNKVQFLINGEIRKTYHENIAFDKFFERNLSLIDGTQ